MAALALHLEHDCTWQIILESQLSKGETLHFFEYANMFIEAAAK